jgi:hypothetical protein
MWNIIGITVLITIIILLGIGYFLGTQDELSLNGIPETPQNSEELDKLQQQNQQSIPESDFTKPPQEVPEGCYDAITLRDNKVFVYQSKEPLQMGVNPKIFKDLVSYRVWTEKLFTKGLYCPILYYDPNSKPYVHPEEKYPEEVTMVVSNASRGNHIREFTREVINDDYQGKPYTADEDDIVPTIQETRDMKSSYIYANSMEPGKYIPRDGVIDSHPDDVIDDQMMRERLGDEPPSGAAYVDGRGKKYKESLLAKSRRSNGDADRPEMISRHNIREMPEKDIRRMLERRDPALKNAKIERVGINKYQITEIMPETDEEVSKKDEIDYIAFGGTIVPPKTCGGYNVKSSSGLTMTKMYSPLWKDD